MARDGIAALLCATVLVTPLVPSLSAEPEREGTIATVLAVQQALKQGREAMGAGQYGAAVHVLEQQLCRINGNREYLAALRDAYRGHVRDLRQAGRGDEAQTYLRRLEILDPGARLDFPDSRPAAPVAAAPPPAADPGPPKVAAAPPAPPAPAPAETLADGNTRSPVVRGNRPDDDPFHPSNGKVNPAAALVASADRAYRDKEYRTAGRLYDQAHEADPGSVAGRHDEWAYCKLFAVKEQFAKADAASLEQLETEVKAAIALSPKVETVGKQYLASIQARRAGGTTSPRHLEQRVGGWSVAESDNFRVFHQENRELAEKVAQVAERTRRDMGRKWFGDDPEWRARCDLYLHPTARDYSRATGKPATWTAHSTINLDAGRVVLRRIDLRGDDGELLTASLPHETTHAVLAGHFGTHHVPRWADEGMALLSEPAGKLDVYRRKLAEARQDGLLMGVRDLMTQDEYPEPRRAFAFYMQSVSMTDYLVKQPGGPQAFARFVNEALRSNYEAALQKTYGLDMATLEQRWKAATFGDASTQAAFRGADR
jgi:hypothetical protein